MNHPDRFLRRAYHRARVGLLVWSLALAVSACVLRLAVRLSWLPSSPFLVLGHWAFALSSATVLTIWIRRARRLSPAAHARRLDAEWSLSARLETSAELSADPSALAAAQRADAALLLGGRPAPLGSAWFAGLALLALAALLLLLQFATLGFRAATASPVLETTPPAAPAADLSSAIVWRSPKAELKATAIEEVPLAATVSTRTGLRSVTLEILVNGEPRLSRPLEAATLAPLAVPGEHALELSLYLDEVGAQEFDLVSYHLRAERLPPQVSGFSPQPSIPPVTSPLQFIQIRPPREDVARIRAAGSGGSLDVLATLAGNLKTAQLQLLKQNFLLAHAPLDHDLPAWREENTRVAADQKLLAQKTAEARDYAIAEGLPALAVDHLGQCIPHMDTAAAQIADAANEPAARPQGRALALLVGIEKLLRKVMIESDPAAAQAAPPPPKNHDPFKDGQQFTLPPRPETPAGELEQLAQAEAAQPGPAGAEAKKDPLAEQAELARRLAALAGSHALDPAAQARAEQAARDAAEAARQLEQKDPEAARAPAEAAAQALREAVAAQEAAGRATAQAQLEALRRELNAAEQLADADARADALAEIAARLHAEALAQQQTGSSEAARQLAEAAAQIHQAAKDDAGASLAQAAPSPAPASPNTPDKAPGPPSPPSPNEGNADPSTCTNPGSGAAAQAAARAQAALTPRDQALARAARQLKPSPRPGQGQGVGGGTDPSDEIQLGAQLASELLPALDAQELARLVVGKARADDRPGSGRVVIPEDLRDVADRLVVLLEAARLSGRRDEQVRRFNPDDLDPAYRPAVETYFEKLSREEK